MTTGAAIVFLLPVDPLEGKNLAHPFKNRRAPVCAPSMWNARAVTGVEHEKQEDSDIPPIPAAAIDISVCRQKTPFHRKLFENKKGTWNIPL
ncbi:hypothetical protein [Sphingopyxis sp. MWB1]|uniref:hypothetical protein n=1 Tax=Sphingopyxis sp. MWB1 TaxID=1537715 RepID=UPI001186F361|nr:hypothetical protein [Sphingopyxis sp. MWB1]